MLILKIAIRSIFRNKRRSALNGIAMCISFILVSISIGMNEGGYARIIEMFTSENVGHVQIHKRGYLETPSLYKTIDDLPGIYKLLKNNQSISGFSPRIYSGALAFGSKKSIGASLIGIDELLESKNTKLLSKLIDSSGSLETGVYISKNIAKILQLKLDHKIILLSQGVDGSIANDLFIVKGILDTEGSTLGSNAIVMSTEMISDYLCLWGKVHEVVITTKKYDGAKKMAFDLNLKLDQKYVASPWYVVKKDFYKAMSMDKKGGYVFLVIIMIVAGIGVLNTVLMSVFERLKEYGLLKAMGTTPWQIFKLIVLENMVLTGISIIPGIIGAYFANHWLSIHGFVVDPPMKYGGITFNSMKSVINTDIFLYPLLIVGVTALVVSILPAIMASRVSPNKVLRVIG